MSLGQPVMVCVALADKLEGRSNEEAKHLGSGR